MSQEVLISISLIIGVCAILTVIARAIKQPPIIAYLIAGVLVGPLFFNLIGTSQGSSDLMQLFAHLGVALLLFIVGLNLDFRVLKEFGKVSIVTGLLQIIITAIFGFLISLGLGYKYVPALYIAAVVAFSSTVLVVKIFSDKKEMDTLHAKISLGILIVQDFVAALLLMIIPSIHDISVTSILLKIGSGIGIIIVIFIISSLIFNRFLSYLARNQEVLFLFGIAWALILSALFNSLGFSLEIGALVAGMSLASSKYNLELEGKIKPLRDFFVVIFFVFFGSQLAGQITPDLIKDSLIISAFVLLGKPLIVMTLIKIFGYKKKTNFLASTSLAQISEFSLILVLLGFTLNQVDQNLMSLAVIVSLITIGISSYTLYYSHFIFTRLSNILKIFEGKGIENKINKKETPEIYLIGYHRIGYKIMQKLKKMNSSFVIVDYNPKVVLSLEKQGIQAIYGDASDKNLLAEIGISRAKLIISTVPDENTNLNIKEWLTETSSKAAFVATSEQPRSALNLYNKGVDYVIVPHHLGGDYAVKMLEKFQIDKNRYHSLGKKHLKELRKGKSDSTFL